MPITHDQIEQYCNEYDLILTTRQAIDSRLARHAAKRERALRRDIEQLETTLNNACGALYARDEALKDERRENERLRHVAIAAKKVWDSGDDEDAETEAIREMIDSLQRLRPGDLDHEAHDMPEGEQ